MMAEKLSTSVPVHQMFPRTLYAVALLYLDGKGNHVVCARLLSVSGIVLAIGIFLGFISSLLAVRKYLNV